MRQLVPNIILAVALFAVALPLAVCTKADWEVPPAVRAQRDIQGRLEADILGCTDPSTKQVIHLCACGAVCQAQARCLAANLELHCADDRSETNRGELGCDCGGAK